MIKRRGVLRTALPVLDSHTAGLLQAQSFPFLQPQPAGDDGDTSRGHKLITSDFRSSFLKAGGTG